MPHKIVFLGDSLTEGYGIDLSTRWTNIVDAETDWKVLNRGISGDTSAGMLARFYPDVVAHEPDYVMIMGGTNDLWAGVAESQIISNIKAMTRQARHHQIGAIIGVPSSFEPPAIEAADYLFGNTRDFADRIMQYQQTLLRFVESDGMPYIKMTLPTGPDYFLPDGMHPNEAAQPLIAELVIKGLRSIL